MHGIFISHAIKLQLLEIKEYQLFHLSKVKVSK